MKRTRLAVHKHFSRVLIITQWPLFGARLCSFSRALIITQWPPFGARLCSFITHLLDFARFHRLLYVTWCKITGQLLRSNPRLRRYLSSEYFRRKETKPAICSSKLTVRSNCSHPVKDHVRRQISIHIFALNGGCCLDIKNKENP